jgi:hypothetical protein
MYGVRENWSHFPYGCKLIYIYAYTTKLCDIREVKNALVKSVYCVAKCTIYSLFQEGS